MTASSRAIYVFLYVQDMETTRRFYERDLGFAALEIEPRAVKYDAGEIILALNVGKDFGVPIDGRKQSTQLIVFHVEDLDSMRAQLEGRGIAFSGATERYDIGATASFYDPDGHCLTLYEPSREAMTWPSARKIQEILAMHSRDQTILRVLTRHSARSNGNGHAPATDLSETLGNRKLLYIFNFVRDQQKASDFYERKLGLAVLEHDPHVGVSKYDAGGILLATHQVESAGSAPNNTKLANAEASAMVFHTANIQAEYTRLKGAGVDFSSEPTTSTIGIVAAFSDPDGHQFYLYQPSNAAISWPSGAKIEQMIA